MAKHRKMLGATAAEHAKTGRGGLRQAREEFARAKKASSCRAQLSHLALAREYIVTAQDELLYGGNMTDYSVASDLHQEMNQMFHQDLLARCIRKESRSTSSPTYHAIQQRHRKTT